MSDDTDECEYCFHQLFNHQYGICKVYNCRCDMNNIFLVSPINEKNIYSTITNKRGKRFPIGKF